MLKIYLDNCCYNRPYDDQSYANVFLETQAKLYIQELIREGKVKMFSSYILMYETVATLLSTGGFQSRIF